MLSNPLTPLIVMNTKEFLSRYMAGQRDFRSLNLIAANLRNFNLSGINLSGANLTQANLTGTNLSYANFTDAILTGANLTDTNLTKANLTNANLSDTNLNDANLSQAYLRGTTMANGMNRSASSTSSKASHSVDSNYPPEGDIDTVVEVLS